MSLTDNQVRALDQMFTDAMDKLAAATYKDDAGVCSRELLDCYIEGNPDLTWLRMHMFMERHVIPALQTKGVTITEDD